MTQDSIIIIEIAGEMQPFSASLDQSLFTPAMGSLSPVTLPPIGAVLIAPTIVSARLAILSDADADLASRAYVDSQLDGTSLTVTLDDLPALGSGDLTLDVTAGGFVALDTIPSETVTGFVVQNSSAVSLASGSAGMSSDIASPHASGPSPL